MTKLGQLMFEVNICSLAAPVLSSAPFPMQSP
jgi:hypothetical protein